MRSILARLGIKQGKNLSGADLAGADLAFSVMHEADLTGADLDGADLKGASLQPLLLSYAVLAGLRIGFRTGLKGYKPARSGYNPV